MEFLSQVADLFLHLDQHLTQITADYGTWTYGILFAIVFCETGLVVTPFLPGDSLLFAAGAIAALGSLDPWFVALSLFSAAVLGDSTNYVVGKFLGRRAFGGRVRWLKQEHLDRTHAFYEKHGGRTVILARFVPIVRTFAPFVAGLGAMTYPKFLIYSIVGTIAWVGLFVCVGYWFGNMPVVKENFSLVILAIIVLSVLPMVIEVWKAKRAARAG